MEEQELLSWGVTREQIWKNLYEPHSIDGRHNCYSVPIDAVYSQRQFLFISVVAKEREGRFSEPGFIRLYNDETETAVAEICVFMNRRAIHLYCNPDLFEINSSNLASMKDIDFGGFVDIEVTCRNPMLKSEHLRELRIALKKSPRIAFVFIEAERLATPRGPRGLFFENLRQARRRFTLLRLTSWLRDNYEMRTHSLRLAGSSERRSNIESPNLGRQMFEMLHVLPLTLESKECILGI